MNAPLRFDGRVAVVTGAGGNPSLGRAHALLLAARGASVVVNDIGHDPGVPGYTRRADAQAVAREIRETGGRAVASTDSVTSAEEAAAIIDTALDAFGRIDILVNNAGISIGAPFEVMTARDFERHIAVNLMGTYYCCHAAWPHMKAQGYGRIVNTASSSMTGFANQAAYAASKGGVWSLTRALAAEGAALGVHVNALSPGGYTRMVQAMLQEDSPMLQHSRTNLPPELCSPALGWLCHEDCEANGECIDAVGGTVQRTFMCRTRGIAMPALTIEDVAAQWDAIVAEEGAQTLGVALLDTSEWKIRPYAAERDNA
ncbi:SDR family NAD(P)-dependent oxidoreductase [Novosphingobium beihaiensis]|uniref:SDR family NAD(P)-dependent oxidoreductase n=1 Tax=Novosphingobium beihaiensis TaxID=2930389 RepID=A0ABT0BMK9_9SPHN|nr:SDR family NAD(P)-dependent oxidoreductase [Novosphingobium beihaiensis]MCJ2186281.1 SDR family NAD(P)-dependent oxidoreductase [Novosphingobium beihaiensis]